MFYYVVKLNYAFFVIYRSPNSDGVAEKFVDLLLDCIAQYATLEQTNIITGDLNCPKIDW